jgi:hypothetical protein
MAIPACQEKRNVIMKIHHAILAFGIGTKLEILQLNVPQQVPVALREISRVQISLPRDVFGIRDAAK